MTVNTTDNTAGDDMPPADSPQILAIARSDGSGEVTVDGISHAVIAEDMEAVRRRCLDYVLHNVVAALGRTVTVEARDSVATYHLYLHPDASVTEAAPAGPPHPDLGSVPTKLPDPPFEHPIASSGPAGPTPPGPGAATPAAAVARTPATHAARIPTLDDLLAGRANTTTGPAMTGWRSALRTATGGIVTIGPSAREVRLRQDVSAVQRSLDGPKTIVVINPKGGANKTTATLLLAAAFGTHRGGYTLAWDNNETRGTLGWRAQPARHTNTAVDLLRDLNRFDDHDTGRIGDLDNYVRTQGSAQFDALASDEDAASAASIDADAFNALHHTLERFYRILVVDTGNNMRASNWQAAITAADQLVIVSTIREDTAQGAAWAADALRATGHAQLVADAVTILAAPAKKADANLSARLHQHFSALTRVVVDVPYDPALVQGGPIDHDALDPATRTAWLHAAAVSAEGL